MSRWKTKEKFRSASFWNLGYISIRRYLSSWRQGSFNRWPFYVGASTKNIQFKANHCPNTKQYGKRYAKETWSSARSTSLTPGKKPSSDAKTTKTTLSSREPTMTFIIKHAQSGTSKIMLTWWISIITLYLLQIKSNGN